MVGTDGTGARSRPPIRPIRPIHLIRSIRPIRSIRCQRRPIVKPLDYLVFSLVTLGSLVLAAFNLCPVDWLWAALTIAVAAFWTFAIYRRARRAQRSRER